MPDAHVLQAAAAIEPRGLLAAGWFVLANLIRELNIGDDRHDALWAAIRTTQTRLELDYCPLETPMGMAQLFRALRPFIPDGPKRELYDATMYTWLSTA